MDLMINNNLKRKKNNILPAIQLKYIKITEKLKSSGRGNLFVSFIAPC